MPVEVLKARYKELYLKALTSMMKANELNLTNTGYDDKTFINLKNKLYESDWVVYVKESFKNSDSVIKYLANYTHRIAVSNYRIIKLENDQVYFKYRDYKDENKEKIMIMGVLVFIRKFLNHVVPERFVRVRYYGLLAHRNKKKSINDCRTFYELKVKPVKEYNNWQEYLFLEKGLDVRACIACGKGRMKCVVILGQKNKRSPP